MGRVWYDARIRDGQLWASWPGGTKVLVSRNSESLAVGPTYWVFDGRNLRQIVASLLKPSVLVREKHSDQELCETKAKPFVLTHKRARQWKSPSTAPEID